MSRGGHSEAPKLGVYGIEVIEKPATVKTTIGQRHVPRRGIQEARVRSHRQRPEGPDQARRQGDGDHRGNISSALTSAVVRYKLLRSPHSGTWYPSGRWDWLYGRGYWWFGHNYLWYPGFSQWGCMAPYWYWHGWAQEPPELVIENQVAIGADGKVEVVIDTATAKELHGNQDHAYTITVKSPINRAHRRRGASCHAQRSRCVWLTRATTAGDTINTIQRCTLIINRSRIRSRRPRGWSRRQNRATESK